MDQGVSLFIDPTGAETGGRVVKRNLKEIGDAAIGAQQQINLIANVTREAAKSAEGSFRIITQQQDMLREKYDAVFAAQQRYSRALEGINEAQRLGAITASQRIDLTIRETNSLNAQINTMARLAQTRKQAAQAAVDRVTISPDREMDIAAYAADLDALQAKYDPLFAAAKRYETVLSEIDRAHRVGAISASQAIDLTIREKAALEATAQAASKLAAQQKALAQHVVNMRTITPDRGADIAAYANEMDELQAKFDPLFSAQQRYNATLAEIDRAQRVGAISTEAATAARTREKVALDAQTMATKALNTALVSGTAASKGARMEVLQRANLIYQLNDVFVSLASGIPVGIVMIQQGLQISQIYGNSVFGALKAVADIAVEAARRFWPLIAAGTALYGVYKLISSFSFEARNSVSETTKAMAEQAQSISQLKGSLNEYQNIRSNLIDAQGVAGALGSVIQLQGNYSEAIRNTATVQQGASSSVVASLQTEYRAKKALLEIEMQLQKAKLATMQADLAIEKHRLNAEIEKNFPSNPLDEAQGFRDPKTGQIARRPDADDRLQRISEFVENSEQAMKVKRLAAEYDLASLAVQGLNTILNQTFQGAAVKEGLANITEGTKQTNSGLSAASQNANTLMTTLAGLGTVAQNSFGGMVTAAHEVNGGVVNVHTSLQNTQSSMQTMQTGVVNVTQTLAKARVQAVGAMQQGNQQITTLKKELGDVRAALKSAASIDVSELFGGNAPKEAAAAIKSSVTDINTALEGVAKGTTTMKQANDAIEEVRKNLIGMGADSKAVDAFINAMIAGHARVIDLSTAIKQLSLNIMSIPNKMVSIGIQQYTVGTAGGGTKGVNVYGGNADFNYQQYEVGGKTIGVSSGNGAYGLKTGSLVTTSDLATMYSLKGYSGARAAGGPVSAGGTYLVGENGPELLTMPGAGQVTNTNSTAAILSGGRDTLSLIEDHLYSVVQELRIHTNYFETFESDFGEMVAGLKALKTASSSYGGSSYGGSSSGSSRGSYGGSSSSGQSHLDPYSPYYFDARRNFAGTGGGRYDPVADAMLNGNVGALAGVGPGPGNMGGTYLRNIQIGGFGYTPTLLDRLRRQVGFANNGQIMPGEDQKVEFFKRNKERVIIVDDNRVSDQRGGKAEKPTVNAPITVNFNGGNVADPRSRQAMADDIRRTVLQVIQSR